MRRNAVISFLAFPDYPKTRIMATVGESNHNSTTLLKLLEQGASIFRFNAAHIKTSLSDTSELRGFFGFSGDFSVESVLDVIRRYEVERQQPITTYLDLAGPKIRVVEVTNLHKRFADLSHPLENLEGLPLNYYPNHPHIGDTVRIYKESSDHVEIGDRPHERSSTINAISKGKHLSANFDAIIHSCTADWWGIRLQLNNFEKLSKGTIINFKDGLCKVEVKGKRFGDRGLPYLEGVVTEVDDSFLFMVEQGANPQNYLFPEILTGKDIQDLAWGLKCGFDVISVSFVCSPLEAFQVRYEIRKFNDQHLKRFQPPVFAKIETAFAVKGDYARRFADHNELDNWKRHGRFFKDKDWDDYLKIVELYKQNPIAAICEAFDGVMVARGDLAVEADKYALPSYQEDIIRCARIRAKPVIVATEVLESMKDERPATRAEISDIANSVDDGADIIMLSGEVASTRRKNPADVVREARRAIEAAELRARSRELLRNFDNLRDAQIAHLKELHLNDSAAAERIALGTRICNAGAAKRSEVVIVSATSGVAARYVSFFQPAQRIVAVTHDINLARQLVLSKGIYPFVLQNKVRKDLEDFILATRAIHIANHIAPWIDHPTASLKRNDRAKIASVNSDAEPKRFIVPGLLRTTSKYAPPERRSENGVNLPNTLFEFELSTAPGYPEEREIKYILSSGNYERLSAYLEDNRGARSTKCARQWNFYYYDDQRGATKPDDDITTHFSSKDLREISQGSAIFRSKGMVRIRIVDQLSGAPRVDPAIFLTLKSEGFVTADGTESRPELEYDVTQYLLGIVGEKRDANSLERFARNWSAVWKALPVHFLREIVGRFRIDCEGSKARDLRELRLIPLCYSENVRLTAQIHGDLILELDRYQTKEEKLYYELEIETFEPDEDRRDEYVHLLFSALDIPEVVTAGYPSKVLRALSDHGVIDPDEDYKSKIAEAHVKAQSRHTEVCNFCKEIELIRRHDES